MYAIIKTGGKQYTVRKGDVIDVELICSTSESEKEILFNDILMVSVGDVVKIGAPTLNEATVKGELLGEAKGEKLIVYKYKRRKNCHTKKGHRQKFSKVKITSIDI